MIRNRVLILGLALGASLVLVLGLSLALGVRALSLEAVVAALDASSVPDLDVLVVRERIPRTIFGLLAGAALGVSGALFQSVTRNPVADPGIMGVNSGAALFVVAGIAFLGITSVAEYLWFAILGAALSLVLVYGLGSLGPGGPSPLKLALAGAVAGALFSSVTSAILLPRTDVMNVFRFWQVGSLAGAGYEGILTILPLVVSGLVLAWGLSPGLDALALGDDLATGLGASTGRIRLVAVVAAVLLCGASTALGGPLGFVGLMVPHAVRMVSGPRMVVLIPYSALGGAVLLIGADILGRISGGNGELEAGIVTALLGAPVLLVLAVRSRGGASWT